MATPLKTQITDRIKTIISGITGINSVAKMPSKPIDRDLMKFDAAFIFDDEETNEIRNRVCVKSFPLHVEIWIRDDGGGEDIGNRADIYQSDINKALLSDSTLNGLILALFEGSANKFLADEDLGGIILLYQVKYGHKYGDPYDRART